MRDPDLILAYEAKQQDLVTGIVDWLHQQTRDNDNYLDVFSDLAIAQLQSLNGLFITRRNKGILEMHNEIWKRVDAFVLANNAGNETFRKLERDYLHWKVTAKLLESLGTRFIGDYQAFEIHRHYA